MSRHTHNPGFYGADPPIKPAPTTDERPLVTIHPTRRLRSRFYEDRRTVAHMAATLYPMYLQAELLSSSTQPGAASMATDRAVAAARCIWNETKRQMPDPEPPPAPDAPPADLEAEYVLISPVTGEPIDTRRMNPEQARIRNENFQAWEGKNTAEIGTKLHHDPDDDSSERYYWEVGARWIWSKP